MFSNQQPRYFMIISLMLAAASMRILPHPANFSPVTAMALFGAAHFARKDFALLLPMAVMLLSDAILELMFGWGFHDQMFVVYASFALIGFLGFALRRTQSVGRVAGLTLAGSTLFFITTNFGVWLTSGMYAKTVSGLISCYIAALPFYQNTLLGDCFYSAVMFGSFAWYRSILNCKQPV